MDYDKPKGKKLIIALELFLHENGLESCKKVWSPWVHSGGFNVIPETVGTFSPIIVSDVEINFWKGLLDVSGNSARNGNDLQYYWLKS